MKKFLLEHKAGFLLGALILFSLGNLWFTEDTSLGSPREAGMVFSSFFESGISDVVNFFNSTINSINELSKLKSEYQLLSAKLQELERQQSDLELLRNENSRLKSMMNFALGFEYQNIPAQVIAKDPGVLFSTLVINKGYNHGVRSQMPVICVINGQKGLVGKVGAVSPFSSQIIPVFDNRNSVAARLSDSRYEGLIIGNGTYQDNLKMVYIDPKAQSVIKVGEIIHTSGLSSMYPSDIPIGKVSAFTIKPHASTLEIEVEPLVDFTRVEYVYVLVPEKKTN